MIKLTAKQVALLKKAAHHIEPSVHLGKNGITDSLIDSINDSLYFHELIKVKFVDFKSARKEMSIEIASKVKAILVTVIGNNAVLFRQSDNPEKRRYLDL